jgi:Na+/phosphate symporter
MHKPINASLRDIQSSADAIKAHVRIIHQHSLSDDDIVRLRAIIDAARNIETVASDMILDAWEAETLRLKWSGVGKRTEEQ